MCSCQQSARSGCTADMITGFKFTETRQKKSLLIWKDSLLMSSKLLDSTLSLSLSIFTYVCIQNIATKCLLFYAIELCIFYWPFERWEKNPLISIAQSINMFLFSVSLCLCELCFGSLNRCRCHLQ